MLAQDNSRPERRDESCRRADEHEGDAEPDHAGKHDGSALNSFRDSLFQVVSIRPARFQTGEQRVSLKARSGSKMRQRGPGGKTTVGQIAPRFRSSTLGRTRSNQATLV